MEHCNIALKSELEKLNDSTYNEFETAFCRVGQKTLSKNESVLTREKEIANTVNNYFINITKHLNLKPHTASNTMDIGQITSAFNNHVSIKKIREVFPEISSNNFELTKVTEESVKNEVLFC